MNMVLGFSLQNSMKNRYTKLAKFDISSALLDTIFGSVRILSTHVVYLDIFMAMYVMDDIQTPFVGLSVDTLVVRSASWCHYL